ncbi:hypothetical protein BH09MYX1_BH09MYX1_16700 [soil metagenome]
MTISQLALSLAPTPTPSVSPTHGGARAGAGRKRMKEAERKVVPHRARPVHRARHPLHVTLRARAGLPSFREQAIHSEMVDAIAGASRSPAVGSAFRVIHFSVQSNHVHLVVEANDKSALSRGMLGLNVRLARAVNRVLGARGRVWRERYHGRALETPREVRNALVYVLMNVKKHSPRFVGIDYCSSAIWFDGFAGSPHGPAPPGTAATPVVAANLVSASRNATVEKLVAESRPVVEARTWLASTGWRKRGLLRIDERPRARR